MLQNFTIDAPPRPPPPPPPHTPPSFFLEIRRLKVKPWRRPNGRRLALSECGVRKDPRASDRATHAQTDQATGRYPEWSPTTRVSGAGASVSVTFQAT